MWLDTFMVGDHKQLPGTVISKVSTRYVKPKLRRGNILQDWLTAFLWFRRMHGVEFGVHHIFVSWVLGLCGNWWELLVASWVGIVGLGFVKHVVVWWVDDFEGGVGWDSSHWKSSEQSSRIESLVRLTAWPYDQRIFSEMKSLVQVTFLSQPCGRHADVKPAVRLHRQPLHPHYCEWHGWASIWRHSWLLYICRLRFSQRRNESRHPYAALEEHEHNDEKYHAGEA